MSDFPDSRPADPVEPPEDLLALIRAGPVVALTGAGVSAESGIPTFREARTGIWSRFDPETVASRQGFLRDPERVWRWYAHRRNAMDACRPNPAHLALARMERQLRGRFDLVTQNIDGLHQAAGSRRVLELHGSIRRYQCFEEGRALDAAALDLDDERPAICPNCGGRVRPAVVWFGEPLPSGPLMAAIDAIRGCKLFLSIGTSGAVEPAASLAFEALARGAPVVEVNPEETPLSPYARWVLRGPAGAMLPALVDAAWPAAQGPVAS